MVAGDFPGGLLVKNPPAHTQGTQVDPLLQEDAKCWGSAKTVCHNCGAWRARGAQVPQLLKPMSPRASALQQEKQPRGGACTPTATGETPLATTRESRCTSEDPAWAKMNEWMEERGWLGESTGSGGIVWIRTSEIILTGSLLGWRLD